MKNRPWIISIGILTSTALLVTVTTAQDVPAPPVSNPPDAKQPELEKGIQVENRGPIHEAFANPGAQVRGKEGFTAEKAPPPPVPELPPDEKPSGENVQWISGYWQWDTEKKDFIWVSGFWRNVPPGRTWTPGEWRLDNGQHRYIPGYWRKSSENSRRIDLPEPPSSVENGPNVPAPHNDAFWVPGHWVYRDQGYVWRPGYWGEVENDMVWTPGQYNYTGSGYCWNPGYWDYCLEDRGLLYAPVYFTQPLWLTAGWRYRPCFGINVGFGGGWAWGYGGFYDSLFIGPGYGSFWFGNFYGPRYWGAGYRPWCWGGGRGFSNHVYNHYSWLNRGNPQWRKQLQAGYAARSLGVIPGTSQRIAGTQLTRTNPDLNPKTLNTATTLANRLGGEKLARQLQDRVTKGQSIQQVNAALKQSGSMNVVQPASEVLKNQQVVKNLPAPPPTNRGNVNSGSLSSSTNLNTQSRSAAKSNTLNNTLKPNFDAGKSVANSTSTRSGLASNSRDQVLRNSINQAIRQSSSAPSYRNELNSIKTRGITESNFRSFGGTSGSASRQNLEGINRSGMSDNFSSSRSFNPPNFDSSSRARSFNPSSSGSGFRSFNPPSSGSRGGMGSGSMGGSRGGFGGGSRGGGGKK